MKIKSNVDDIVYNVDILTAENLAVFPIPLILPFELGENVEGVQFDTRLLCLILSKDLEQIFDSKTFADYKEMIDFGYKLTKPANKLFYYGSEKNIIEPVNESIPITLNDQFPSYLYHRQIVVTDFLMRQSYITKDLIYKNYFITQSNYCLKASII